MNGLANSIAQRQARRDVEMDCHGGPVSNMSGPPETTASLARGGPPLQAHHQRWLQPPSGTFSPPTVVISDSAFEEWLQSDNMKMPMFSQSEGPQQSAPTAVTLTVAAPAAEAVTDTRVFPAVLSKSVAEAPASSVGAALAAVPAAAPATGGTVAPAASTAREARALASAAGSAGEIFRERGASTHPFDPGTVFPLEVRHSSDERARHNSSSGGSSSSSSNDNTNDHGSWCDTTCVGALLRPFDPGK